MAAKKFTPGPLVRLALRSAVRAGLRDAGADPSSVTDEEIEDAVAHAGGLTAPAPGSLIQWLLDHKEQIAKIVALILAALGK